MYEKLKMTANPNEGSFVKTLTGRTGTGFQEGTHVHKDWYARTLSYEQGLEMAENAAREREDLLIPVKNISGNVNNDNQFVFKIEDNGSREFVPTDHALEQFSTRIGVPSSTILRELRGQEDSDLVDADIMARIANNSLRRMNQDKVFRLRTYTDGTCRAFVSDRYAPVDNRWYLETLKEFLPEGRLSHWRGDEDTIYGNILLPDSIIDYGTDDDSDYGGMISVGNCEIGKRVISQKPSLFRSICMNGCIWGQVVGKQIRKRHIGNIDLDFLKMEIGSNIQEQLPLLPTGITTFLETRNLNTNLDSIKGIIATISKNEKLRKVEASEIFNQYHAYESHERNLFGVVNAVTRAGQRFNNDRWLKFDEIGGNLINLNQNGWNSLLRQSSYLEQKDFDKVFGVLSL